MRAVVTSLWCFDVGRNMIGSCLKPVTIPVDLTKSDTILIGRNRSHDGRPFLQKRHQGRSPRGVVSIFKSGQVFFQPAFQPVDGVVPGLDGFGLQQFVEQRHGCVDAVHDQLA